LGRTFVQQRDLVNTVIVPTIMGQINIEVFPIVDGIIYDMIHNLHRHRREEFRKESRSATYKKGQEKRKHSNTRRHDVSK